MIDTHDYYMSNNTWLQIVFALRHPIYFITHFKEDMYNWPSLSNTIRQKWMWLYTRLPLQKACRWLGHELVYRVNDNKLLEDFWCRTRDKDTKYYGASCRFGRIKFYEKTYICNGKNVNLFMDITVTSLVDEEQGRKTANSTKTIIRNIYSGWVFSKRKAIKVLKKVILDNPDIYKSDYIQYPEINDPYNIRHCDEMYNILHTGKSTDKIIFSDFRLEQGYKKAKDKIEKLYYYMLELLTAPNDFNAHSELAWIFKDCEQYLYWKEVKKNPSIDFTCRGLIKAKKEKELKTFIKDMCKMHSTKAIEEELDKKILELKNKYINEPYSYYRI